ncbi:MAG: hypothetical protein AAF986_08880 [Pseudomonadota bacterium]
MKIIIVSLLNIAAVGGGIYGGSFLRPAPAGDAKYSEEKSSKNEGTEKGDKKKNNKKAKGNDKGDGEEASLEYFSVRFSRPFVVPVTDGWRTQALVVLKLNVEVEQAAADQTAGLQDKMRDRIMSSLIGFSHEGGFAGATTDPALYDAVRVSVRDAVEDMFPEMVGDVLILELLKRSV